MAANGLTIDRLSVHAPGRHAPGAADTAALRVALEQALRQVRPSHLPPQAVLVIRTLASRTAFGAGSGAGPRWRQQFESQLAELARQALRPDQQHVPPDANCVLFDDEVTLLACLTRDVLAGRWTWYWDELFPRTAQAALLDFGSHGVRTPRGHLLAAWLAYPQAVPHTLVALQPAAAAAALSLLSSAELSQLAQSLHDTFALPRGALDAAGSASAGLEHPPSAGPGAPWREWLPPHQLRGLAPPAEYVLGLCYTLAHRPQEARELEFGAQARRWLEDKTIALSSGRQRAPVGVRATADTPVPALGLDYSGPGRADGAMGGAPAAEPPADGTNLAPGTVELRAAGPDGGVQASTTLGRGTFTRLGGAIFLVNLMILLGLPQSIPALARLNPWSLLGALAASLLGRRFAEYAADPLWTAIDELGGEETLRPWGAHVDPAAAFRVPGAWGKLLPPEHVVAYREPAFGGLQVWAGGPPYLLAELPPEGALAAAKEEWPALAATALPPANLEELTPEANRLLAPELAWWVRRLQLFIAQLLARLTGLGPDAAAILLYQPGTLYAGRTHVDLVLPLEQISIPLRRAGLDQTPGWQPEFGYIITIHFE